METHYGYRAYWVRPDGPETLSVQVRNNFALPNITAIGDGMTANWHVPIDDTHHWKYWAPDVPVGGRARTRRSQGEPISRATFTLFEIGRTGTSKTARR